MSDYPMLISNKLHSFRNFSLQNYDFLRFRRKNPKNSYQQSGAVAEGAAAGTKEVEWCAFLTQKGATYRKKHYICTKFEIV